MQRSPPLNMNFSIAPVGQNGKEQRSPAPARHLIVARKPSCMEMA